MKKYLSFPFLFVLFISLCLCKAEAVPDSSHKLTLMIYMCGSNLEEDNGSATADIQEMLASGCDFSQVNLIILAGGAKEWHTGFSSDELTLLELGTRGMRIRERLPSASMGDPVTLEYLLTYGLEHFPANEYALILWDHGAGPLVGLCQDELFSRDMLTLDELVSSLKKVPFPDKLNWIGFDACLMSSLEVAAAVSPYAEYMIASEELEPSAGWDYSFLHDISECESGADAGRLIVDRYVTQELDNRSFLTLASMDLQKMEAVRSATDQLFNTLFFQLNGETFSAFSRARQNSLDIGRKTSSSDYDLVDLLQLSRQFEQDRPEEASALQQALEDAVYARGNLPEACGVSIYSPQYNKFDFQNGWLHDYQQIACLPVYTRYLDRYAGIWLGEQLADWTLSAYGADPIHGESQTVRLELTEEQLTHFSSARVIILRETGSSDTYQKVYEINDVHLQDHMLSADYSFDGLYLVNDRGELLTDSYPFEKRDEFYYVNAILEATSSQTEAIQLLKPDTSDDHHQSVPETADETAVSSRNRTVRLAFRASDEDADRLELMNIIFYDDESERIHLGRQSVTFDSENWPWLYFFQNNIPLQLSRDEKGQILPVSLWNHVIQVQHDAYQILDEDGHPINMEQILNSASDSDPSGFHLREEVRSDSGWSLHLQHAPKSGMNLYAQYIITDTQGNETASELIFLDNQAVISHLPVNEEIFSSPETDIRLKEAELVHAETGSGLTLRFQVRNDSDYPYRLSLLRPEINRIGIPEVFHSNQLISPHSKEEIYLLLPLESFPPLPDGIIHSISFTPELENQLRTLESLITSQSSSPGFTSESPLQDVPEHIVGNRVTFSPEIDVSVLNPPREWPENEAEALGEASADGVLFQLTALHEESDGSLSGTLFLENTTDQDQFLFARFSETDAASPVTLNGYLFADNLEIFNSLSLPARSRTCTHFRVFPAANVSESNRAESVNLLDYWDIRQIDSIGFLFCLNETDSIDPSGPPPLTEIVLATPLPLLRKPAAYPEKYTLIDEDAYSLTLRGFSRNMKTLKLHLDIRNKTNHEMTLHLQDFYVNNSAVSASMYTETAPVFEPAKGFLWRMEERAVISIPLTWELLRQDPETLELRLFSLFNDDHSTAGVFHDVLLGISESGSDSGYQIRILDQQKQRVQE